MKVLVSDFIRGLREVSKTSVNVEDYPALGCVQLTASPDRLTMAATDRYMAARAVMARQDDDPDPETGEIAAPDEWTTMLTRQSWKAILQAFPLTQCVGDHKTIFGPLDVRVGDTVTVSCPTAEGDVVLAFPANRLTMPGNLDAIWTPPDDALLLGIGTRYLQRLPDRRYGLQFAITGPGKPLVVRETQPELGYEFSAVIMAQRDLDEEQS